MIAAVEKPDGSFEYREMGEPECGEDFCDGCGDCLDCQPHGDVEWCPGGSRWIIYLRDEKNPFRANEGDTPRRRSDERRDPPPEPA